MSTHKETPRIYPAIQNRLSTFSAVLICLLITPVGWTVTPGTGAAGESTFSNRVEEFTAALSRLPVVDAVQILNGFYPAIAAEMDMSTLYTARFDEIRTVLDSAVSESVDVLTLFTHPALHRGRTLVADREILARVDRRYDLHALFLLSSPSVDAGGRVHMVFLLVGQGKLIIGYDRNALIRHPDYQIATARYDYQRLFIMDSGTDGQGRPGLFAIRGMSGVNEAFSPMKGPLNTSIHSLLMVPDSSDGKKIVVKYSLFGDAETQVVPLPIQFREDRP